MKDDNEFYAEYSRLHRTLTEYREFDEAVKVLPTLFAAKFLSQQLHAEVDRIIEALGSRVVQSK